MNRFLMVLRSIFVSNNSRLLEASSELRFCFVMSIMLLMTIIVGWESTLAICTLFIFLSPLAFVISFIYVYYLLGREKL